MTLPEDLTIFIIEDDPLMAECLTRAVTRTFSPHPALSQQISTPQRLSLSQNPPTIKTFPDAVSTTAALADNLPSLILLDVLLNGPDGFTFLNEIISYSDTAKIPVIIVTSLNLADKNLEHYGVRAVLSKDTMTPTDIQEAVRAALAQKVDAAQTLDSTRKNAIAQEIILAQSNTPTQYLIATEVENAR